MKEGFIKSYRPQNDDELYFSEPFTKWQAWHDLLFLAAYKDMFVFVRGVKVEVRRGQIAASDRFFAERWRWSRGKVERFLQLLTDMQRIEPQKSNVITLISIINYSKYQDNRATNEATNEATDEATNRATNRATNEATNRANINEINKLINQEEKNINTLPHARAREIGIEAFGSFSNVFLFPSEHRQLVENYGQDLTDKAVDDLACKIAEGDDQALNSRNHYATLDRWLRYKRETGKVPMTSTAADPMNEKEKLMRIAWKATDEKGRQEYLDGHEGLLPWEYERKHQQP